MKTQFDNAAGTWVISCQPEPGGAVLVRQNGQLVAMYEGPHALADAVALAREMGSSAQRVNEIKHSGLRAVKSFVRSLVELAESGPALSQRFPRYPSPRASRRANERLPLALGDGFVLHGLGTRRTHVELVTVHGRDN